MVYSYTSIDINEEDFLRQRDTASTRAQALSTYLAYGVHKLRQAMGNRDGEYVLAGRIELDEGYFSTKTSKEDKDKPLKRGRGSQRKSKVLVMAESEIVEFSKKGQKPRRVGYLKMKVIDNLKRETINEAVQTLANKATEVDIGGATSYTDLKDYILQQ